MQNRNTQVNKTLVKTWKVRTTVRGVVLTLNGQEFDLGTSADAIAFDLSRAAAGWNAPEETREAVNGIDGVRIA